MKRNELSTYSPNSVWEFMSEMDRAFDDFWKPQVSEGTAGGTRSLRTFTPAVDLHETDDFYLISVDLPGIAQKDVKIDVQNGRLSVSGERSSEVSQEEGLFKRFERSYGRFERSFQLPQDVDDNKIQARMENGVLEIMVPKAEVAKPRSIQVESEKGGLFSRLLGKKNVESSQNVAKNTEEKH
jgi:HSP20 family protein